MQTSAPHTFTADIYDVPSPETHPLKLSIDIIQNGMVRLRINEDPEKALFQRFKLDDIITPSTLEPFNGEITSTIEKDSALVVYDEFTLTITFNPFRLTLGRSGSEVISLNPNDKLHFEQYRLKQDEEEDGVWEEKFKAFTDTKPRGPASIGLDIQFTGKSHLFGIPEHSTPLSLPTTIGEDAILKDPFRLYNLDVFKYELNEPMSLYGSIPFLMAPGVDDSVGVYWNNPSETYVDIYNTESGKSSRFISETGILDLFLIIGVSPASVLNNYVSITGLPALPQKFAVAYHQCRWNYRSQDDVAQVDKSFDDHDIPYDVIWLDIEHTDGKRYFTWDKVNFPNPLEMQNSLDEHKRKLVTIVDPHTKREDKFKMHEHMSSNEFYIKDRNSNEFQGHCWPGSSAYPDFLRKDVRDYWATLFSFENYKYSSPNLFVWNDMNEPSIFSGPEVSMDKDCIHLQGKVEHREVHNLYGHYVVQATFQGQLDRQEGRERPFVLTRSFFAGTQRYAAAWTGDNAASWDHLEVSTPMLLSLSIAGMPFVGADVGGFFGIPDDELLVRWYQIGAFQPFFRAHAHIDTPRREPYLYDDGVRDMLKKAVKQRYALLPLWYTAFWQASRTGAPVIRPLWFNYPEDKSLYDIDNEYMVGSDLLVKPVTAPGIAEMPMLFPGTEKWYNFYTFQSVDPGTFNVACPLDTIPVYQRAGSIVAKQERARRSSTLMDTDPYTLIIAADSKGVAEGQIYIDDGHSNAHEQGVFAAQKIQLSETGQLTNIHLIPGTFQCSNTIERIVILGVSKQVRSIQNGSSNISFEQSERAITVRKPLVPICSDFTISLTFETQ